MPTIEIPGTTVYYERSGAGPLLLQIHGSGLGHWNVSYVTAELLGDFTCIDLDLPGYGRSGPAPRGGGIVELADTVADVVDALGIGPVHVHGTSFGGLVAVALAARHPQLVDKLIVSAALLVPDGAAIQRRELWERTTATGDPELYAALTIHCGFARPFFERPDAAEILAAYRKAMVDGAGTANAYHDAAVSMQTVDMMPLAHAVRTPTLVVGGADDVMTPLRPLGAGVGGAGLAEIVPDGRLAVVPDAAHFLLVEQPRAVADHFVAFLGAGTRTGVTS